MALAPFTPIVSCDACLHHEASYRFCVDSCIETSQGVVENNTRLGDSSHSHLHRVCARCGFEWLMEPVFAQASHRDELVDGIERWAVR